METSLIFILVVIAYFIPSLVAGANRKKNGAAIFVLNLLLGWSVIGWVVSLVWALTKDN